MQIDSFAETEQSFIITRKNVNGNAIKGDFVAQFSVDETLSARHFARGYFLAGQLKSYPILGRLRIRRIDNAKCVSSSRQIELNRHCRDQNTPPEHR